MKPVINGKMISVIILPILLEKMEARIKAAAAEGRKITISDIVRNCLSKELN